MSKRTLEELRAEAEAIERQLIESIAARGTQLLDPSGPAQTKTDEIRRKLESLRREIDLLDPQLSDDASN